MKKCPKCGYIVVKDDYCKICKTCVIYENHIISQETKSPINKYIILYHIQSLILPVIAAVIAFIFTILSAGVKNELIMIAIIFNITAIISGIFKERFLNMRIIVRRYTKEYAMFNMNFHIVILSIVAIFFVIVGYRIL